MASQPEATIKRKLEPEEIGVSLILAVTQALFENRETVPERAFDRILKFTKQMLQRTERDREVRCILGTNPKNWKEMVELFMVAIPELEVQSFISPHAPNPNSSTSTWMAMNYATLIKDLERLNDILLIARNILVSVRRAQNLAAESGFDKQVFRLIDLCIRVTARGYDGEVRSRNETQWTNIVHYYKMMLISCLQFLVNFIQKNDKRKFVLWLDLFANSRTSDENLEATLDPRKDEPVAAVVPGKSDLSLNAKVKALSEEIRTMRPEAVIGNDPATLVGQGMEVISDKESVTTSETNKNVPPDGVGQIASRDLSLPDRSVYEALEEGEKPQLDEDLARTLEGLQIMHEASSSREPYADVYAQSDDHPYSWSNLPNQTVLRASSMKLDEMTVRTPESAAEILQQAKDQLMARLEQHPEGQEPNGQAGSAASENDDEGDVRASDVAANGSVSGENNDDESTLRNVSDQERGLLTDLPLVLSPKEIEALPMILQAGIVGDLRQGELPEGRDAPDMDSVRCKILLAQESGRNLLREMLIFIAAWDLQDNELYFQLMTQIMEAILENGLMPFAYQAFGEEKDIVSPAQSMVIKILTQIFRNPKHLRPAVRGSGSTVAGQRREITARVDTLIVRNIFTTFRQCIIPETCALIYLQGQIRANIAAPEDFPFNSWDMERVYEGVYQFLEFFAVLTESEEWKGLLVQWEIVSELVTLLRELDASIPKAPLGQGPLPQTAAAGASIIIGANAKSQAMLQQSFPTPVAVERPYDQAPSDQAWPRTDTADGTTSESASVPLETLDACEFEWRNLKKLVVLVLSSLVWHSPKVQDQIRHYGGVEMMLGCCNYDAHNPYIREHAIMCLRFLLEDNQKNMDIVRELSPRMAVPDEVLDKRGYETYIDSHGKVGLRAKDTSIKIIAEPRVLAL